MEIQILIYLSHVVVRDLVLAKLNNRAYEGEILPDELLEFLKRFKTELYNLGVYLDGGAPSNTDKINTEINHELI